MCDKNVKEVKIRINVGKEIVNDYLAISQMPWFNNRRLLKVTFVSDNDGPRCKFFSGLQYILFVCLCYLTFWFRFD
jgi:hypothetical protein